MSSISTLTKINSILKSMDEESRMSLLRELQLLQGYMLAETNDKRKNSAKKILMKEIVAEVRKVRKKRSSGKKHAA
jgi:hypothetical protein